MKLQEGWIAELQGGKVQHAFVPSIPSNPAILSRCSLQLAEPQLESDSMFNVRTTVNKTMKIESDPNYQAGSILDVPHFEDRQLELPPNRRETKRGNHGHADERRRLARDAQ